MESALGEAVELTGLSAHVDDYVSDLPAGQRRLVELARCISGGYSVLLLDEPSAGLDVEETLVLAGVLRRLVDERGVGILLVEHDMSLVMRVCDYLYVLDFGELVVQGTPTEIQASALARDVYLGTARGADS